MKKTSVFADKNFRVGEISPRLYGSFIEHLGRAVYGGIYDPDDPSADENGFRKDVVSLVRELHVPIVRYPGGNFVSGYEWTDGVGPKEKRPARLDLAWHTTETNEFGTDEFVKWCRLAGVEPMLAVNMGTGTVKEAARLVEYCNHAGGTALSDYRRANGAEKPYGVTYWCIGNEMDGPWQIGHLSADDYGKKALEAAKVMRWTNGETDDALSNLHKLKLVVSGSSNHEMDTFPEWDRVVLEHTYGKADYLSMHRYYEYSTSDKRPLEDFFGAADNMAEYIETLEATIEYVRAKYRTRKQVYLSFDEWNVWKQSAPRTEPLWKRAPRLIEDIYTFRDSLVFAGLMNTLLNHCDLVKMGCLAQLVNVIAPITTERGDAFRQSIFYPFKYLANNARGATLRTFSDSDLFENKYGKARSLNEAVCYDAESGSVVVSLVNYAQEAREVSLELRSFGDLEPAEYVEMTNADLGATNGFSHKEDVVPAKKDLPAVKGGTHVSVVLPAMSWSYLKFKTKA